MKLYSSWTVGALSIKNERANSAYMKEPKTYNTIDEDYRIQDGPVENIVSNTNMEEKTVDIEDIEVKMEDL